jgi:peptidyl-tRNA hydrolase, PTH1 family
MEGVGALLLAKPLTYMNLSGNVLPALMRPAGLAAKDLIVVADDINLPLGKLRIRAQGGAGGHNGLKSVIERVGTEEFVRVRVGVGEQEEGTSLKDHVLERMGSGERRTLAEAAARAADALECILVHGTDRAMNEFN